MFARIENAASNNRKRTMVTRTAEAEGIGRTCGCHGDCWCKKPGLTLFRWVLPRRAHHMWTEDEKRAFAEASARE
jgi:hypothetical protein